MDTSCQTRLLRTQGVTAPAGFRAAGIAAGIKKSGKPDLALIFNEGPDYAAAGVFTINAIRRHLPSIRRHLLFVSTYHKPHS